MFDLKSRVLIVDDAIAMRMAVKKLLKEIGFSDFTEAENGRLAFDLIQSGKTFDLILSDHHMPECTGMDLLKKVRTSTSHKSVPFLLVTSETEKAMVKEAIQNGATNYVTKPVSGDELKNKLEAAHTFWLKLNGGAKV